MFRQNVPATGELDTRLGIREGVWMGSAPPGGHLAFRNLERRPLHGFRDFLDLMLQIDGAQFGVEINSNTSLLAETGA